MVITVVQIKLVAVGACGSECDVQLKVVEGRKRDVNKSLPHVYSRDRVHPWGSVGSEQSSCNRVT